MRLGPSTTRAAAWLQTAYTNGGVGYPRVDNDLMVGMRHELFPHPRMPRFTKDLMALKPVREILINKRSAILVLGVIRVFAPSDAIGMSEAIDYYLDDHLNFVSPQREKELTLLVNMMFDFLANEAEVKKEGDLLAMEMEIFAEASREESTPFVTHQKSAFFINDVESQSKYMLLEMVHYRRSAKMKAASGERLGSIEKINTESPDNFETFSDAVDFFRDFMANAQLLVRANAARVYDAVQTAGEQHLSVLEQADKLAEEAGFAGRKLKDRGMKW